jgi:tetratricopeptide (TPR) repeat protein
MTAGGLMLRRGEADGVDDKGSREFVTLWVSESQARERMNLESLSHFVAAVAREVRDRVDDATDAGPLGDGELDVACALLPNGRLLLDVQLLPQSAVPAWVGSLEQRLSELALPPVRTSPVAFSFRISLGKGVGDAQLPFRVPFTRWAEDWSGGSLDQLIRAAAAQRGLWTGDGDWPVIQRATLEGAHLVTTPAERSLGLDRPLPEDSSPLTPTPPSDVLDRNSRSALAQRLTQRLAAYPLLLRARIVWRRFRQWVRAQMQRWHYPRPDAAGESSVVAETTVGSLVSSTVGSSRSLADATDSGEELEARAADDDSRDEESPLTLADLDALIASAPERIGHYRLRAELRRDANDFAGAIADYTTILALDGRDVEARLARGAAYCVEGNTSAGLADFEALLALDPLHVAARYNRGILLIDLEAYEAAVEDFSQAIEADPWSPRLWIARGRAQALLRDFPQAWDDFSAAIRLDPHDDEPYALRAACARFARPFPECAKLAIDDYGEAIRISPTRAIYYLQRAEHHWAADEYDSALADCDTALRLVPDLKSAHGLRGAVYLALDQLDLAVRDCSQAIEAGDAPPQVYLTRAEAYLGLEQWDQALDDAEIAVERAADSAAAWKCRGLIRARLEQFEQAISDFDEAIRLAPDQPALWCHRAALHRHVDNTAQAVADCDQALALVPEFAPALLIRAGCNEDLGEHDAAIADLDEVVRLAPTDAQSRIERANYWMRVDDYDRAKLDFDAILQLDADSLPSLFHRGQILAALGDLEGALVDLNRAIEIDPQFAPAFARRANVRLLRGELELADADYRQADQLDEASSGQFQLMRLVDRAHYDLQSGRVEQALAAVDEALELSPNHPPALHVRTLALLAADELVEALEATEQLREEVGDSPSVLLLRAQTQGELGEFEAAWETYDEALLTTESPTAPHRGALLAGRAFVRAGLGDLEGADRDLNTAIPLCPDSGWLHYQQGRVYHERQQTREAVLCFRLALTADRPKLTRRQRERAEAYVRRYHRP